MREKEVKIRDIITRRRAREEETLLFREYKGKTHCHYKKKKRRYCH